ncbi:MAG: 2Fe-2S iron-sulfur cluster-binding protein [Pseudomonadota bacterium]
MRDELKARQLPTLTVQIDGAPVALPHAMTVLAALMVAARLCTRRGMDGAPRFALCGIGLCQECRVSIDGQAQRLACQTFCRDGMRIVTAMDERP